MSLFGKIKKSVSKAAKAVTKPKSLISIALNPIAATKATVSGVKKATTVQLKVLKTVVTKPKTAIAIALNPVKAVKTAVKVIAPTLDPAGVAKKTAVAVSTVNKKVAAAATAMHLPSLAATMDLKKAVTNPKAYVAGIAKGYGGDLAFAGQFYTAVKTKNLKGLITQGGSDTAAALKALGAPSAVTNVIAKKTQSLAAAIPAPKPAAPAIEPTPNVTSLTGDLPVYSPSTDVPMTYDGQTKSGGPPVLLIAGAAVAVLVLVFVATR